MGDVLKSDLKGYGLIFKSLTCNENLDIEAKGLFAYLSSYAGASDVAFPGVELICHQLNISEPRFKKYRKQLEEHGYISIKRQRTKNGFSKNIYTLHHKSVSVQNIPVRNLPEGNLPEGNVGTKNNSLKNNSLKSNSLKNICATDVTQESPEDSIIKEFNEWYDLYDKKKDRKAAFTKFKTVRKKHELDVIMKGTRAYLKTITDKQYQKYPKTFLHNESFLDDFTEEIKTNNKENFNDLLNNI